LLCPPNPRLPLGGPNLCPGPPRNLFRTNQSLTGPIPTACGRPLWSRKLNCPRPRVLIVGAGYLFPRKKKHLIARRLVRRPKQRENPLQPDRAAQPFPGQAPPSVLARFLFCLATCHHRLAIPPTQVSRQKGSVREKNSENSAGLDGSRFPAKIGCRFGLGNPSPPKRPGWPRMGGRKTWPARKPSEALAPNTDAPPGRRPLMEANFPALGSPPCPGSRSPAPLRPGCCPPVNSQHWDRRPNRSKAHVSLF